MTIPFFEPDVSKYHTEVANAVRSNWIGAGPVVQLFEHNLREFLGANSVVATTSGTMALTVIASIIRSRCHNNDSVFLVPAYGVTATANAIDAAGGDIEFLDIDPYGAILLEALEKRLRAYRRDTVAAVVWVHFSGIISSTFLAATALCEHYGIPLIEDAACALGSWVQYPDGSRRAAGTVGTFGALSFSVPKLVTTGQGGAIICRYPGDDDFARRIINHGSLENDGKTLHKSWNARMTDMQAALGNAQLRDFLQIQETRRVQFVRLRTALNDYGVELWTGVRDFYPPQVPLHNIVLRHDQELIVKRCRACGVGAQTQYWVTPHLPYYRWAAGGPTWPNAELWHNRAVYLPFGRTLTYEDAGRIARAVCDVSTEGEQ